MIGHQCFGEKDFYADVSVKSETHTLAGLGFPDAS